MNFGGNLADRLDRTIPAQTRVTNLDFVMSTGDVTDARDLVDRLCTIAGMIFEDVSPVAISPGREISDPLRIEILLRAATDAASIAAAAEVVARRYTLTD